MKTFWVSYDLLKQKDYAKLVNRLTQLGAKKVLLSMWTLKGNYTCVTLCDDLKTYIDTDDRLVVIQSSDWATLSTLATPNDI